MTVKPGQKLYIEPSGACTSGTIVDGDDTRAYTSEKAIEKAFIDGDVEEGYIFIEVEVKRVVKVKSAIDFVPLTKKS
jgi:hypothetical protein